MGPKTHYMVHTEQNIVYILWFSGLETASDSVIRWFESSYPSQFMHDFVNKQHKIVHIFYFYTLPLRLILAENQRLGRDWGVKGEQKMPAIGYKA